MLVFVFIFSSLMVAEQNDARSAEALAEVTRQVAGVTWNASPEVADYNCDGRLDHAFLGMRAGKVIVAFRLSRAAKVQWFEFGVDSAEQESICEKPAEIYTEDLDSDPSEAVDGVEGFKLSRTCKGLQLVGGECDFYHFYWNHVRKRMDWWRL
ncbi:MAG: hypothetical protein WA208_15535 [Thermoanaerobaculia bacterium]